MATITQAMLESRVGQAELIRLTDDAASGAMNATVLAQIISEGEAEVLGYLGQKYVLPLALGDAGTLATVRARLVDVITFRLYVHRDREANETQTMLYRAAIDWAVKIAKGEIGLVGESENAAPPAAGGKIYIHGGVALFGREDMEGL